MTTFIVHTIPGSPFARAVGATLEEKGAQWQMAPVVPGKHKEEPHLSRHPFGRMPVLEHDGFLLYETQAILRYLDRILPGPALTPCAPRAAARMDQVMNISDWYLFPGCANVIVFQRVIGPRLLGLTPNEAAIAEAMPRAHLVFDELSHLLGDQPYFAGDALSLADLHLGPQIDFFAFTPEWKALTVKIPNLVAWLARLNARPSMQATSWENIAAKAA
ncbi:MAG TPA: glutathione S-transferase family protein [Methylocella sp.]|nr:glutathione S-transferase family protein [Methylocella sp.]